MSAAEVPSPVQAMVDAINAGDTDAFVDAFNEDGLVDDWGNVREGPDGLRSWAESDAIGKNARMTIIRAEVAGGMVTTEFEWKSEKFNGTSTGIFTIYGEKLASFRIPPH